tara:strand:+ start:1075 stop:1680 length:606 start_codon:yes stop_codon:yes gene_type:complete
MGIILVLTLLLVGFLTALFVFHKHSENELNHRSQVLEEVAKCKLKNERYIDEINNLDNKNRHNNESSSKKECPVCPKFQNLDKVCPSDKYILKSKIKPFISKKIKMAKYIRKCPKCPTCPKCPESSNNKFIPKKSRFFPDDLLGSTKNFVKKTAQSKSSNQTKSLEQNQSEQLTELKKSNQEMNNIELEWIPVHNTKCRVD